MPIRVEVPSFVWTARVRVAPTLLAEGKAVVQMQAVIHIKLATSLGTTRSTPK